VIVSSLLPVLFFGFVLGIKHAIEPDHVIAVSTIASRTSKLSLSSLSGIFWGIGHTMTLLVIGIIMIVMERQIPEKIALSLEFFVGMMVLFLGIISFRSTRTISIEREIKVAHLHLKSLLIGTIHGLAGSAGMVILTLTTVNNMLEALIFILIFGFGTICGMMLFTTVLGLPFVWVKDINIYQLIVKVVSIISVLYGLYYIYHIGILELFNSILSK
jgi:hypothetical protein